MSFESDNKHVTQRNPSQTHHGRIPPDTPHIQLRVLETTDVHANLLPFDYYTGETDTDYGLTRTATLIAQAREETANTLLFDNGDALQGTPVSDLTAQPGSGWNRSHPVVTAMNLLRYDAAGLGNHEFNFGLDWLRTALKDADFPVVCANAAISRGTGPDQKETLYPPYVILRRSLQDTYGADHDLSIGVLGLVPPQITTWDHYHLDGQLETRDIVDTARMYIPQMQAKGADVIIVLAHTGIDADSAGPMQENAALALASVPGITAILAGHVHEVFPMPGQAELPGVDNKRGTLNGVPTVMAGFRGAHLGVIDLSLINTNDRWSVVAHQVEARSVTAPGRAGKARLTPAAPALCDRLAEAHRHTLGLVDQPLGKTVQPLHSYLALARNDPAIQLVCHAKRAALAHALDGNSEQNLPILSASAPYKTGGRAGPTYFTDIPAGDLRLRNAADLYVFPNTLCGVRLTGARLREWLECSAICFNQITPGKPRQALCDPQVPGHNFDVIHGLTYDIDLTQPARYDRLGRLINSDARRIGRLRYQGHPVDDAAEFIIATNSYRAYGGGPFPKLPDYAHIYTGRTAIRELLTQYIARAGTVGGVLDDTWRFAPIKGATVTFDTGPGVRRYKEETEILGATDLGDTENGFARFHLTL